MEINVFFKKIDNFVDELMVMNDNNTFPKQFTRFEIRWFVIKYYDMLSKKAMIDNLINYGIELNPILAKRKHDKQMKMLNSLLNMNSKGKFKDIYSDKQIKAFFQRNINKYNKLQEFADYLINKGIAKGNINKEKQLLFIANKNNEFAKQYVNEELQLLDKYYYKYRSTLTIDEMKAYLKKNILVKPTPKPGWIIRQMNLRGEFLKIYHPQDIRNFIKKQEYDMTLDEIIEHLKTKPIETKI